MKSTARDAQIRKLFEDGLKGEDIAHQVGVSTSTVWTTVKRLNLTMRRGHSVRLQENGTLDELEARARRTWGRVDYDEADLPNGTSGHIAFIADRPGYACATKLAALRSAIALR